MRIRTGCVIFVAAISLCASSGLWSQTASGSAQTQPVMMPKDADPDWQVATVRPSDPNETKDYFGGDGHRIIYKNESVEAMLVAGYGVQRSQIVDAPDWIRTERWDVEGLADVEGKPSIDQIRAMIRKILAERFGLQVRREQREMPVYALTVAKGGPKLTKNTSDPNGAPTEGNRESMGQTTKTFTNTSMPELALMLVFYTDRPVVDQTGLQGRYDFKLTWTSNDSAAPTDGSAAPGLFTAIQEQDGLKLEPTKATADVLVVEKVQRPSAN